MKEKTNLFKQRKRVLSVKQENSPKSVQTMFKQ